MLLISSNSRKQTAVRVKVCYGIPKNKIPKKKIPLTGEGEDSVSAQLQLKKKLKPEVKDDFVY